MPGTAPCIMRMVVYISAKVTSALTSATLFVRCVGINVVSRFITSTNRRPSCVGAWNPLPTREKKGGSSLLRSTSRKIWSRFNKAITTIE